MKTIKSMALAIVLLAGTSLYAVNPKGDGASRLASQEIEQLLSYPNFLIEENSNATVTFMVNNEGVIQVLKVEDASHEMQTFIKSRLNNQILETSLAQGKRYAVPLKIVSLT